MRQLPETERTPAAREAPAHRAPEQLGQYQLLEKLGQGGMGSVYRALHVRLKRIVAVKLISPQRLADEQALQRFQREMEAVGRLDHANVIRASDAGEVNGIHFCQAIGAEKEISRPQVTIAAIDESP